MLDVVKLMKLRITKFLPVPILLKIRWLCDKITFVHMNPSIRPSYPRFATIDICNICNLKCPLCPTGMDRLRLKQGKMDFVLFREIIDKLFFVEDISLVNWGEVLLHSRLIEMIEYVKSKGKVVSINTHLSIKKKQGYFNSLVNSGIDRITLSIDGASQETYSKYRINGNFQLVIENIKMLVDAKKRFKKKQLLIEWKFIPNKYNEHEISTAKKMARELGVRFRISSMVLLDYYPDGKAQVDMIQLGNKWLPGNNKYISSRYKSNQPYISNGICDQLFNSIFINIDGKVLPCCFLTNEENSFGSIRKERFDDIWYNDKYISSRALFVREHFSEPIVRTVCRDCNNYDKVEHS